MASFVCNHTHFNHALLQSPSTSIVAALHRSTSKYLSYKTDSSVFVNNTFIHVPLLCIFLLQSHYLRRRILFLCFHLNNFFSVISFHFLIYIPCLSCSINHRSLLDEFLHTILTLIHIEFISPFKKPSARESFAPLLNDHPLKAIISWKSSPLLVVFKCSFYQSDHILEKLAPSSCVSASSSLKILKSSPKEGRVGHV